MLYNISLPLCFDDRSIIKYLYAHDKFLRYKCPLKYIRYAPRGKYHKLHHATFRHYKYFYSEELLGECIVTKFLNNSFERHAYPFGYFQNLVYFDEINSVLRKEFKLQIPLKPHNQASKTKIDQTGNSVFLHVRLGDYLRCENLVRLGKTYYQSAIEIIKTRLGQPHIFIFSNDIEWCEKNLCNLLDFKGCHIEFVKGNGEGNAAEEMELMRACKHAIIANSTFSWWASYLIDNPDKQIIMPTQFVNNAIISHTNTLAKKGYILIDPFWGTHSIV
ncbi:MAG: alpha-1,2-fucosyltransferase [Helicobacter trogontum]|uniref:alpha-1,2-fucosyltransferase n=1 Tax=Helicobacter trogontum TaxID=50960 RepID=UPI00242DD4CD|nr:alpha-1,2-fucosyltransferase [Helicobacter trogontum]MCI5786172.1 alpha-1,2-fucosyltransferase [Helicobacter trogontum]